MWNSILWFLLVIPAMGAYWNTQTFQGCSAQRGSAIWTARLQDIWGDWKTACRNTPITIAGSVYSSSIADCAVLDLGAGGQWGKFYTVNDPVPACNPTWSTAELKQCMQRSSATYEARLWGIADGVSWVQACQEAPITVAGRIFYSSSSDCVALSKGVEGQYGRFYVGNDPVAACNPTWDTPQLKACPHVGMATYEARLLGLDSMPSARYGWQQACREAPITIAGQTLYSSPADCTVLDLGILGQYGRFNTVNDPIAACSAPPIYVAANNEISCGSFRHGTDPAIPMTVSAAGDYMNERVNGMPTGFWTWDKFTQARAAESCLANLKINSRLQGGSVYYHFDIAKTYIIGCGVTQNCPNGELWHCCKNANAFIADAYVSWGGLGDANWACNQWNSACDGQCYATNGATCNVDWQSQCVVTMNIGPTVTNPTPTPAPASSTYTAGRTFSQAESTKIGVTEKLSTEYLALKFEASFSQDYTRTTTIVGTETRSVTVPLLVPPNECRGVKNRVYSCGGFVLRNIDFDLLCCNPVTKAEVPCSTTPQIMSASASLALKSSSLKPYLSAQSNGDIIFSLTNTATEKWQRIPVGNFVVFKSLARNYYLRAASSSLVDGRTTTMDASTLWIATSIPQGYSFFSPTQKMYLSSKNSSKLLVAVAGSGEAFQFV